MAKPSKTEKFLTSQITAFYNKHAQGKVINIMDMGKVTAAGRAAGPEGLPAVEAAVIAAIAKYCIPA